MPATSSASHLWLACHIAWLADILATPNHNLSGSSFQRQHCSSFSAFEKQIYWINLLPGCFADIINFIATCCGKMVQCCLWLQPRQQTCEQVPTKQSNACRFSCFIGCSWQQWELGYIGKCQTSNVITHTGLEKKWTHMLKFYNSIGKWEGTWVHPPWWVNNW